MEEQKGEHERAMEEQKREHEQVMEEQKRERAMKQTQKYSPMMVWGTLHWKPGEYYTETAEPLANL